MADQMRPIEISGENVEAAIAAGLDQLGLSRDQVIIEILEEGRAGILGLGSRDAVVRLTPLPRPVKAEPEPEPEAATEPVAEPDDEPAMPDPAPVPEPEPEPVPEAKPESDVAGEPPQAAAVAAVAEEKPVTTDAGEIVPAREQVDEEEDGEDEVYRTIVASLLAQMGFEATVTVRHSEPDDRTGREMTIVDVRGDDVGSLIGPHGSHLTDLQYIARLMAGHVLRRRANFLVDVDGYREQHAQGLQRMAERMAEKALKRGEPVTLEPMSAYDRRLIHMALRDRDDVYTQSTGEGARRRVRVYPDN